MAQVAVDMNEPTAAVRRRRSEMRKLRRRQSERQKLRRERGGARVTSQRRGLGGTMIEASNLHGRSEKARDLGAQVGLGIWEILRMRIYFHPASVAP